MKWFLTTVLCAVLIEIVVRLPLRSVILRITRTGHKAAQTMKSKAVSDHWKEKALLSYAGTLFAATMKLAGYLVVIGVFAVAWILIADHFGATMLDFLSSWIGIVFSIVVATVYMVVRKKYV